jgi:membrane associated rhomboid family serine protease/Flp pilus assembly protein TadD
VAGGVGLLAAAVTAMTLGGRWSIERFDIGPTAFRGEPWRLLTATLPHLDVVHLGFNVYWLWVFGTLLEEVLGHARILGLVALFAVGSGAADYALSSGGVGLSGVGYGLFGLLWVLSSRDKRFAGAVDARTAQLFVVWFFFCILTTYLGVFGVANVAHGAGALLGILVGLGMSASASTRRRIAATAAVPVLVGAALAGATVLRPRVNFSHDGSGSFQLGYAAIQDGRFDDAVRHYRDSVAMNGKDPKAWHNLGVAEGGAGQHAEAVAAYRRAYELDAHNLRYRDVYLQAAQRAAVDAQEKGDHAAAVTLLREVVAVEPADRATWALLAGSYQALGRADEAAAATAEWERLAPKP